MSAPSSRPVILWHPPLPAASDDSFPTHSSREQQEVERRIDETLKYVLPRKQKPGANKKKHSFFGNDDDDSDVTQPLEYAPVTQCPALCELSFPEHAQYLLNGLLGNSGGHYTLDASRPWIVYWCLHGLDILERLRTSVSTELGLSCVRFLESCTQQTGGFAGGPTLQQAHTAPTYASVLSLAILTSLPEVEPAATALLKKIRRGVYDFHLRCKVTWTNGHSAFRVSADGEIDTRGAYTVLSVASLLNTLTPTLSAGVSHWLAACQTYEGGLAGEPMNEAHGGYTFCGVAAMILLKSSSQINIPLLLKWSTRRQMEHEGGFQGRTNKLVDGCYSFWTGALFPMLDALLGHEEKSETTTSSASSGSSDASSSPPSSTSSPGWLFDTLALQRYLLISCQTPVGGLRDKPGKPADLYHTCYCLSGLSIAQNSTRMENSLILGREENIVAGIHPVYNIRYAHVERMMQLFANEKFE